MLKLNDFVISLNRESTSCLVIYGYKRQTEALKAFEEQYFGSHLIWKTNVLFFKGNKWLYGTKFRPKYEIFVFLFMLGCIST